MTKPPENSGPSGKQEGPFTNAPLSVFVSYASADHAHRDNLVKHLAPLRRQGVIETWSDREVLPGENWGDEIRDELEKANVILLLVSADFLVSDYCYDLEMRRALDRHRAFEARVIPIIVDHCDWTNAPFAKLQALPERAKPIAAWSNPAEAWANVAAGIRQMTDAGEVNWSINPTNHVSPADREVDARVRIPAPDLRSSGNPVVGWLVATDGPDAGRDYRIYAEGNTIGREPRNKIRIEDDSVSRDTHAVLTFDPKAEASDAFVLRPSTEHLIYLFSKNNGRFEAIHQPTSLKEFDQILIGRTSLVFVPLCGDRFEWDFSVYEDA